MVEKARGHVNRGGCNVIIMIIPEKSVSNLSGRVQTGALGRNTEGVKPVFFSDGVARFEN